MAQIFHPSMNTISRISIFGAVFIFAAIGWLMWVFYRSAYQTQVGVVRPQPVQFSHEHHVGGLGIDCRYCHTSVEISPFAGIPSTQICMQCHSQIWADSPKLEPVRESFRTGRSISWTRVHDVPDFVYFDHSIHVAKGVGCVTCHGRVDTMPLMWRTETLHMDWCVDCHRNPRPHLRSKDSVFSIAEDIPDNPNPNPNSNSAKLDSRRSMEVTPVSQKVSGSHPILDTTNCSVCHR